MKLLIIDNETIKRGAQMFGQHLKKHLNATGHECMRIFLYSPEEDTSLLHLDDDDRVLQGTKNNPMEFFPSVQFWLCRLIAKQIHAFKPDVVLLNGARSVKYGGIVKRFYYKGNAPFVVRVIDSVVYWNRSWLRQWYSRNIITPQIDGAIGVGHKALKDYRDLYKYKGPGVSIPRSFDFGSFTNNKDSKQLREEFQVEPSRKIVLYLGNITKQKRPDRFMRVFSSVSRRLSEAEAWIVGDGDLKSQMQDQASHLGLSDKVKFFGYQNNVEKFIVASDVLLITSDTEGVPGIAVEALYLEKPVVSTNAGDVTMVVHDGINGFVNEMDDEEGLADNVMDLLSNPGKADAFGKKGKEHVKVNFDLAEISDRYIAFFEEIIQQKKNHRTLR